MHTVHAGNAMVTLSPTPPWSNPSPALLQSFAATLAFGLGLRSLAAVDGFVHVDTGELVVLDVKPFPSLTDGSPIWQQVRQQC